MGILASLSPRREDRSGARTFVGLQPSDPALANYWGYGSDTDAGVAVTPNNARECPEVDACIGLNEDTVATVPLDLFERKGSDDRQRADGHPLHQLLHDKPNNWQSSADFRQMMEGWRETHGNAYARVTEIKNGFPAALEPVHPDYMRPFMFKPGQVAYRWSPPDGSQQVLMQHEVLHLRDTPACYWNLCEGESRVRRHRQTIGKAMATASYVSRFFKNAATPKIGIEVPGRLDDTAVEELRKQWETRHAGLDNSHRVAVSHSGMKVTPLGTNNTDAEVIKVYDQATAQIARIWDVPLHLIGEVGRSTSWGSGIEQQSIGFVVYNMRAKFVQWEQALNLCLMSDQTRQKFYFEFNIDALLRGDFKTRMEGYALMIQWGLATPNEIRRLMNFPPLQGGDERLQPLNMVPASRIMDVLLRTPPGPQQREAFDQATAIIAAFASQHLKAAA